MLEVLYRPSSCGRRPRGVGYANASSAAIARPASGVLRRRGRSNRGGLNILVYGIRRLRHTTCNELTEL